MVDRLSDTSPSMSASLMAFWMPSLVKRWISCCRATLSWMFSFSTLGAYEYSEGESEVFDAWRCLSRKYPVISLRFAIRKKVSVKSPRDAKMKILVVRRFLVELYER